jgi:hypothetical protein
MEMNQTARRLRTAALSVAVVDVFAVVCLVAFFVVGGPLGTINDVANAAVGVLSGVLAWLWHRAMPHRSAMSSGIALSAAAIGAILMVVGSVLVIFDVTGYFLAGLYSSIGAAFLGIWLLAVSHDAGPAGQLPRGLIRLGFVAGAAMLLGLLAVPGAAAGIDDPNAAPWYVTVSQVNWLGTYVLYPIWCIRLAVQIGHRTRDRGVAPTLAG